MANEERIVEQISNQFAFLVDKIRIQRPRRIFAECPSDRFLDVVDYMVHNMFFDVICSITGTDEGEYLSAIYHFGKYDGMVLNMKISVPKANPQIKTISSYFPCADLYERELIDLLGFEVEGLNLEANRYPLVDDWPKGQYPLRKDWKLQMLNSPPTETDNERGE